ncbi:MAG TPA: Sapep family Mn(2+)-dependent dipeptidase, partial [Methanotrichaceae archaeon]|nr:Sapep family Mn(2+)-dependent dipeptidase [Methanotrichaceae archaeon]
MALVSCLFVLLAILALSLQSQGNEDGPSHRLNLLIEENRGALISSTQDLIKIKSIRGGPGPGAPFGQGPADALDRALDTARSMGFNVTNMDGYIGYAEYGQGDDYVAVLSHMDTVPEGGGWTYPPYGAEIHDGKIFGRGATDDKGPSMAALYGLMAVRDSGLNLSKKVRIIFGTTEETGREDIEYYLEREKVPASGFTPDGEYPVILAEKGFLDLKLARGLMMR